MEKFIGLNIEDSILHMLMSQNDDDFNMGVAMLSAQGYSNKVIKKACEYIIFCTIETIGSNLLEFYFVENEGFIERRRNNTDLWKMKNRTTIPLLQIKDPTKLLLIDNDKYRFTLPTAIDENE